MKSKKQSIADSINKYIDITNVSDIRAECYRSSVFNGQKDLHIYFKCSSEQEARNCADIVDNPNMPHPRNAFYGVFEFVGLHFYFKDVKYAKASEFYGENDEYVLIIQNIRDVELKNEDYVCPVCGTGLVTEKRINGRTSCPECGYVLLPRNLIKESYEDGFWDGTEQEIYDNQLTELLDKSSNTLKEDNLKNYITASSISTVKRDFMKENYRIRKRLNESKNASQKLINKIKEIVCDYFNISLEGQIGASDDGEDLVQVSNLSRCISIVIKPEALDEGTSERELMRLVKMIFRKCGDELLDIGISTNQAVEQMCYVDKDGRGLIRFYYSSESFSGADKKVKTDEPWYAELRGFMKLFKGKPLKNNDGKGEILSFKNENDLNKIKNMMDEEGPYYVVYEDSPDWYEYQGKLRYSKFVNFDDLVNFMRKFYFRDGHWKTNTDVTLYKNGVLILGGHPNNWGYGKVVPGDRELAPKDWERKRFHYDGINSYYESKRDNRKKLFERILKLKETAVDDDNNVDRYNSHNDMDESEHISIFKKILKESKLKE